MAKLLRKNSTVRNINDNSNKKTYVRFRYTELDLEKAVEEVTQGRKSLNSAARVYRIPKGTLYNKIKCLVPMERKMGPSPVLTSTEEDRLEKWILDKAKLGFPMHPEDVKDAVQKVLKCINRQNPFKDDRPGDKWMKLFLIRRPAVKKSNTEMISKARAAVTEQSIRDWFSQLQEYLREEDALDILEDPSRIFNADETGVQTCPKTGVVLGPKSYRNFYEISSGKEKEAITVLCNFAANGAQLPPMIIYPFKRLPSHIVNNVPDGWSWGRSDSGWMVSATFYEYVANVFYPWLLEHNIQFPVLFFLDGHKSHLSVELSDFCAEKKLLVYCLPPNATHIMQPCDVSIFRPIKAQWKHVVRKHKQLSSKSITKSNFAMKFKEAYDLAVKPETIKNGFRACGLYPFTPEAVDYSKCISKRRQEINELNVKGRDASQNEYEVTKTTIEQIIGQEDTERFKTCTEDDCESKFSLYSVWRICTQKGPFQNEPAEPDAPNLGETETVDLLETDDFFNIDLLPIEIVAEQHSDYEGGGYPISELNLNDISSEVPSLFTNNRDNQSDPATYKYCSSQENKENIIPAPDSDDKGETEITEINVRDCDVNKETELRIFEDKDCEKTNCRSETLDHNIEDSNAGNSKGANQTEQSLSSIDSNVNNETVNDEPKEQNLLCERCEINEEERSSQTNNDNPKTEEWSDHQKICFATNEPAENILPENGETTETHTLENAPHIQKDVKPITIEEAWEMHLTWPKAEPSAKKRKIEKVPFAITSKKWREIQLLKENKKIEEQKAKEKKKLENSMKKELKKDQKKEKTCNSEKLGSKRPRQTKGINVDLILPTDEHSNDNETAGVNDLHEMTHSDSTSPSKEQSYEVDQYVKVMYDGVCYPGIVKAVNEHEYEVSTMIKCQAGNTWRWPEKPDQIWYEPSEILGKINPPKLENKRGIYSCDNMLD